MHKKNYFLHLWATIQHKLYVLRYASSYALRVMLRALSHDLSKLSPQEFRAFSSIVPKQKATKYFSEEYKENLASISEALKHHYRKNRHHPEHHDPDDPKISSLDLVDLTEMFCDWKAAVRLNVGGDIFESIKKNKERYHIPEELCEILRRSEKNKAPHGL